jgi:hypothetical protein
MQQGEGGKRKKMNKQNRQRNANKHNQSCKKAEANKGCNHNSEEPKISGMSLKYVKKHGLQKLFRECFTK